MNLSPVGDNASISNKTQTSWSKTPHLIALDHVRLSTAGDKLDRKVPKNRGWPIGTLVVEVIPVKRAQRLAAMGRADKPYEG